MMVLTSDDNACLEKRRDGNEKKALCKTEVEGRFEHIGKKGVVYDFQWTSQRISHPKRRRKILEKHPEVEELYGYDLREGIVSVFIALFNIYIGYKMKLWNVDGTTLFLCTFFISATLNHILFLSMHEASHSCLFPFRWMNEWYVIFANASMGIPAGMGFIRYHLDHHIWLGVDVLDPDIPTALEGRLFQSCFGKFIWIMLLPITYTLRPVIRNPKKFIFVEAMNWIIVMLWNLYVYFYWGTKSLFYFVGGAILSMSIHPLNGHLIAEHFQFPWGEKLQETFSSYGWENYLTFNSGYHIEHHDFPRIPGLRLPLLKEIASEFYDLPHHTSWWKVVWQFIVTPGVCPFSRVKRANTYGGPLPENHKLYVSTEPEGLGSYWNVINNDR